MFHRTKCNFSTTHRDFFTTISGFEGKRFPDRENLTKFKSVEIFKYSMLFLPHVQIIDDIYDADEHFDNYCYF